jgi:hypothetical protein
MGFQPREMPFFVVFDFDEQLRQMCVRLDVSQISFVISSILWLVGEQSRSIVPCNLKRNFAWGLKRSIYCENLNAGNSTAEGESRAVLGLTVEIKKFCQGVWTRQRTMPEYTLAVR